MERHPRTPLTCPVCHRATKYISTHLRRVCLRSHGESEIKTAIASAKCQLRCIASKGTTIQFSELKPLHSLEETVTFLEGRGFLIANKPRFESQNAPLTSEGSAQVPADNTEHRPGSMPLEELDSDEMDVPFLLRTVDSPVGEPCSPPLAELDSHEMVVPFFLRTVDSPVGEPCPEPDHTGSVVDGSDLSIQRREWKDKNRRATKAAGLYKRHSLNHPMLKGFHSYLTVTRGVPNCQQEVSNVARFLFFVNPRFVTLEYLVKPSKVNNFFEQLGKLRLSSQTSLKMLKHIRRFTIYQMRATKLRLENPQLYKACEVFMNFTTDLQKTLYKGACRESVSKRYDILMKPSKSPKDCQMILEEARPTFLASIEAVTDGGSEVDRREVVLYLQALLILKHLQRPGVVRNMTVSEWNERIHHMYHGRRKTIVGVKTHKCSTSQVATFVLSEEEESWFKAYAEHVRPVFTAGRKIITNFFVTCTGKVIENPSVGLRRYHSRQGGHQSSDPQPYVATGTNDMLFSAATTSQTSPATSYGGYVRHGLCHNTRIVKSDCLLGTWHIQTTWPSEFTGRRP
ncbi:uncharacterized protein LOC143789759 [Ranitomeya variabilis]|uniref:uncharacterized protein LOC143789759 n=1 Tax=Ranitomeya variabilis TaxID=490064 RepID=UPI0040578AAE